MGLNIRPFSIKQSFYSFNGKVFYFIYHFATAIIAFVRKTFGIFICKYRAHGAHGLLAHEIFGSNKLKPSCLALAFFFDEFKNLCICFHREKFERQTYKRNLAEKYFIV